jgi:hypothetical protein
MTTEATAPTPIAVTVTAIDIPTLSLMWLLFRLVMAGALLGFVAFLAFLGLGLSVPS